MDKGRKTSEFWMTVAVVVLDVLGAVLEKIPGKYAGLGSTMAVCFYNLSRGLAKQTQHTAAPADVTVVTGEAGSTVNTGSMAPPPPAP